MPEDTLVRHPDDCDCGRCIGKPRYGPPLNGPSEVPVDRASVSDLSERALDGLGGVAPELQLRASASIRELTSRASTARAAQVLLERILDGWLDCIESGAEMVPDPALLSEVSTTVARPVAPSQEDAAPREFAGDKTRRAAEARGLDPSKVGGGDATIRAVTGSRSQEDAAGPDICECGHVHSGGRVGSCSLFTCPCNVWRAASLSAADPEGGETLDGVKLIAAERERQIEREGYDAEHDDSDHDQQELARAAAQYAIPSHLRGVSLWPWSWIWWKPTPDDRVRELVKAGALTAAEIDRLQRAAGSGGGA